MALYLGIDVGTSGCRAVVIDAQGQQVAAHHVPMVMSEPHGVRIEQNGWIWWKTVCQLLEGLGKLVSMDKIAAIAVDGTSGTLLLTDAAGNPLGNALMYNDARSEREASAIAAVAPAASGAHGASSALAKLLWLQNNHRIHSNARHVLHQADWIAAQLSGTFGISDENNCLKLGYDVIHRRWPTWFQSLDIDHSLLPSVTVPGETLGTIRPEIANHLGLSLQTRIVSGTTDSIAAFLATGAVEIGDAVTSLGSTLALKMLSDKPIFAPEYGVYSHRLGERWLVGGASNCGGATLLQYFDTEQMTAMTPQLDPTTPSDLDYYPLPATGERFPINDPTLAPRITPRPADELQFFQGLLEGIAQVEARGYRLLAELGAPYPRRVMTIGGGAHNAPWRMIRAQHLDAEVVACGDIHTARGSALLARSSKNNAS